MLEEVKLTTLEATAIKGLIVREQQIKKLLEPLGEEMLGVTKSIASRLGIHVDDMAAKYIIDPDRMSLVPKQAKEDVPAATGEAELRKAAKNTIKKQK